MSNKVLDTNYFKKVTDFGKDVFKAEMNNMAQPTIYLILL